ncbi:MAG: tetratricopeptide repeat protein [Burkholderiaceae bacterium]|nr:tetratricopeptide repeat protein [Sulfuritalea sp.]MCF8176187.1 tetratricopeptide repeat protein [Burkholderiaceae bacterium]
MSLVNKMLRDLDARRAGDGDRAALPAAVTPLAARQEPRRSHAGLWAGTVVTLAGIGALAWYANRNGEPDRPLALPAVPAAVSAAAPVVTEPPPLAMAPASPAAAESPGVPPADPAINVALMSLRMAEQLAEAPAALVPSMPVPSNSASRPTPASSAAARTAAPAASAAAMPSVPKAAPVPAATPAKPAASATPAPAEPVTPKPADPVARELATKAEPPALPRLAGSAPKPVALPAPAHATAPSSIDKQIRLPSSAERAELKYRHGLQVQRQGNLEDAASSYRAALEDHAEHAAARQTLAALLIDAKRFDDAEELLRKGTELPAVRLASTLAWARLKVERNQVPAALELLQKHAAAGERSADYQGFFGALLNRSGRTAEAVEHYQMATRLAPEEGRWWAGLGIALDAAGRGAEAREVYLKARAMPGLPADLAQHIERRLR